MYVRKMNNAVLKAQAVALGLSFKVKAVSTTYIYKPDDEAEKRAIKESNFPYKLRVFLEIVGLQKTVWHETSRWKQDADGEPFMEFVLSELL